MEPGSVLITAAVTAEVGPLVRLLRLGPMRRMWVRNQWVGEQGLAARPVSYYGSTNSRWIVALTGVRPLHTAQLTESLLIGLRPSKVIITGFAGATDPAFKVGDVIVPERIIEGETRQEYRPTLPCHPWRTLYTSPTLAHRPADKKLILENFNAAAVDMESAVIAGRCEKKGIPWVCARAISDTADAELPEFLMKLTHADGRPRIFSAAIHAIIHPSRIPVMMRVGRDARLAAEAIARSVTDLLSGNA